jgi:hypothetical protein
MDRLFNTHFPTGTDKDIETAIRMMKERYERFFPQVDYQSRKIPDAMVSEHTGDVQPLPNSEDVDDLWGEVNPPGQQMGTAWQQPHTTERLDATEIDEFESKGYMHVHLNHNPTTRQLKKFGIEQGRYMIATFLVPLLEDAEIDMVKKGDRFFWKDHVYEIYKFEDPTAGYWKNTSIDLYVVCVCKYARYGS